MITDPAESNRSQSTVEPTWYIQGRNAFGHWEQYRSGPYWSQEEAENAARSILGSFKAVEVNEQRFVDGHFVRYLVKIVTY